MIDISPRGIQNHILGIWLRGMRAFSALCHPWRAASDDSCRSSNLVTPCLREKESSACRAIHKKLVDQYSRSTHLADKGCEGNRYVVTLEISVQGHRNSSPVHHESRPELTFPCLPILRGYLGWSEDFLFSQNSRLRIRLFLGRSNHHSL